MSGFIERLSATLGSPDGWLLQHLGGLGLMFCAGLLLYVRRSMR